MLRRELGSMEGEEAVGGGAATTASNRKSKGDDRVIGTRVSLATSRFSRVCRVLPARSSWTELL